MLKLFNLYGNFPVMMLVLLRVSTFFTVFPIFGNKAVPARVRVIFSILITLIVLPLLTKLPTVELFSFQMVVLGVKQIVIGVISGFVFQIVFEIFVYGGQIVSLQSGLGFATLVDPQIGAVNMVSQIYWIGVMLVFLALNGQLMLISAVVNSFQTMPLTGVLITSSKLGALIAFSGNIFAGAVSITLPAIISLLVVNLTFAVMTRAAPSLNIFTIGFPITLIMGLFIIYITFANVLGHANTVFLQGFHLLHLLLSGG